MDYRSSQAGAPQGLEISYTTGHVTWDTSYVMPGDYSIQVVVEDAFTGIRVRERERERERESKRESYSYMHRLHGNSSIMALYFLGCL